MTTDVYYKKTVDLQHARQVLHLRVSQDLFSSYDVDVGTQRLLRSLADADGASFGKILDLGCGYGPLGLTLKKLDPTRTVHLVDRDALAVEYARQNAVLNEIPDVECYASLGYDDVSTAGFDLILSNIPAKAGEPVIAGLLQDAVHYLRPGGLVAIVVVTPLEEIVAGMLADPGIQVQLRKAWPGHAVFHYCFTGPAGRAERLVGALERGVYDRQETNVSYRGQDFSLSVAYGLPEFDTLSYETRLLLDGLNRLQDTIVRRAILLNPGQGYVPVAVWQLMRPAQMDLVDRDLLSLRYSRKNLLGSGCPAEQVVLVHQPGARVPSLAAVDLTAGVLREEEGPAAHVAMIEQVAEQTAPGGIVVLVAGSTSVTRLVDAIEGRKVWTIVRRERSRGRSLLILRRR